MLGWINISIQEFITKTFGADKWQQVLKVSGVHPHWVSSCPYSDKDTFDLVITAATVLGVSVNDALEAYGSYFVGHVEHAGYEKIMRVCGSNVAEFLQNLNNLHLHLSGSWPVIVAPAFRCAQVTPTSLLLHYHSQRPGLWPIVVGVLKGMAPKYFGFEDLGVELVQSREQGADHEVFKLTYPYQEQLRDYSSGRIPNYGSRFGLPPDLFTHLHPYHMILDRECRLLQFGPNLPKVARDVKIGDRIQQHFKADSHRLGGVRYSNTASGGAASDASMSAAASASPHDPSPLVDPSPHPSPRQLRHPCHVPFDYDHILEKANTHFLIKSIASKIELKGQFVETQLPVHGGGPGETQTVMLFLGSPRISGLAELEEKGLYLSDFSLHDQASALVLMAEQRQAEAGSKERYEKMSVDLKAANEKLARTTAWLEEEKQRAEALLYRMTSLIQCFPAGEKKSGDSSADHSSLAAQLTAAAAAGGSMAMGGMTSASMTSAMNASIARLGGGDPGGSISVSKHALTMDKIESMRRELTRTTINLSDTATLQSLDLLGEGTFGKVYKGLWKGTVVAIKTIVLPAIMSGAEKREKMAIMEAAISSSLSHPNIMQTYTYDIKPIRDTPTNARRGAQPAATADPSTGATGSMTQPDSQGIHSFEVRLVLEYCDRGSLREALDRRAFLLPDGAVNYRAVLDTAIDVAAAMIHLHSTNVLHSDLKARNIMLKSNGAEGRGVSAKVADFGLSVRMDHMETHLSNVFQGTMTHMAPEILLKGHVSKAADVYAYGMVLWELYTGAHVFKGVPRALLGHQVTLQHMRPEFPAGTPSDYAAIAQRCWDRRPANRPTFEEVLVALQNMRRAQPVGTPSLDGGGGGVNVQGADGASRAAHAAGSTAGGGSGMQGRSVARSGGSNAAAGSGGCPVAHHGGGDDSGPDSVYLDQSSESGDDYDDNYGSTIG